METFKYMFVRSPYKDYMRSNSGLLGTLMKPFEMQYNQYFLYQYLNLIILPSVFQFHKPKEILQLRQQQKLCISFFKIATTQYFPIFRDFLRDAECQRQPRQTYASLLELDRINRTLSYEHSEYQHVNKKWKSASGQAIRHLISKVIHI